MDVAGVLCWNLSVIELLYVLFVRCGKLLGCWTGQLVEHVLSVRCGQVLGCCYSNVVLLVRGGYVLDCDRSDIVEHVLGVWGGELLCCYWGQLVENVLDVPRWQVARQLCIFVMQLVLGRQALDCDRSDFAFDVLVVWSWQVFWSWIDVV